MKAKIKSYLTHKKEILKKYFTAKRKVDKKVFIIVLICYAMFGGQSVLETILEGSKEILEERFKSSVTVYVNPVSAKVAPTVSKKENVTCYDWAEEFGGENVDLIKRIIKHESTNNPLAKNKISTASGCMQFLSGTWHEQGLLHWGDDFYAKSRWSAKDNVELGSHLVNKGELSRWAESKNKWK